LTAEFNWRRIDFVFPNQSPSLFLVPMKKRLVNWPLGNPDFVSWEVEAAAGLLVARRNHALVRNGQRLCQGSRPLARRKVREHSVSKFGAT
jgi:hypothetical protein